MSAKCTRTLFAALIITAGCSRSPQHLVIVEGNSQIVAIGGVNDLHRQLASLIGDVARVENVATAGEAVDDYLLMYSKRMAFDGASAAQRASNTLNKSRYWSDLDLPNPDDNGFVSNANVGNLSDAIRKLILDLRPDWDEQVENFRLKVPGLGTLPT